MAEHTPTLGTLVVVVVVTVVAVMVEGNGVGGGGDGQMSHVTAGNDGEFSWARSVHPERNFHEVNEIQDDDSEEEGFDDLDIEVLRIQDEADEEEEEEEEEGNEAEEEEDSVEDVEHENHDTKLMNLVETRLEIVTKNPYDVSTEVDDQAEKPRRRRPHASRKARRERRRRRRWKKRMKAAKKYYRRYQTKWSNKKHQKSSGGQQLWISPNKRSGWVSGPPYRSVDPRRVKVRRILVRKHNVLRASVDPPAADMLAVKWYKTAAEQAQAWAEQCGHHDDPEHPSVRWTSNYGACGQNVFVSPTKKRWTQVLEHWWSGKKDFHYGGEHNNNTLVAAYTQMAWYNSHQVGCGFSQCKNPGGSTFFRYVCNYCPAGNNPSQLSRPYTKGSACSRCPGACRSLCPNRSCPLCTNACTYSDLWVNCAQLDQQWHEWLCNTKTAQGVERFKNCRATCQCVNEIT